MANWFDQQKNLYGKNSLMSEIVLKIYNIKMICPDCNNRLAGDFLHKVFQLIQEFLFKSSQLF